MTCILCDINLSCHLNLLVVITVKIISEKSIFLLQTHFLYAIFMIYIF